MKRHSNLVVLLVSFILAVGFTMEADAESISIPITAQVTDIYDPGGFLGGAINVGDVITGTYVYESTTPDTNTSPTVGDYWHTTAPFGITLNAGGLVFRTDPNNVYFLVEILNDFGIPARDNYLLRSYNNTFDISVPSATQNLIGWQLDDPTYTALSSGALPTMPPVLADWQSLSGLTISSQNYYFEQFLIRAHVTSAGFSFTGFFQPVDNLPTMNSVKAGSAIPVKFSLNGDQGLNIFAEGYPASQPITCDSSLPFDNIEVTVNAGSSSLSYDAANDEYNYVWKTNKAWIGTCRRLIVRLSDGSDHVVNFRFK
ncbi:MAG TPA: PxKF domain-containing protein [Thermodesulfobacteriota bacterium]|nr:PxKF domain-containing protein [Thermodesulfobacteriota bacterium]